MSVIGLFGGLFCAIWCQTRSLFMIIPIDFFPSGITMHSMLTSAIIITIHMVATDNRDYI